MKFHHKQPIQEPQQLIEDKYYSLRLYIAGTNLQSILALKNIKQICETYLKGHYDLEVIDVYQQPELTQGEAVFVVPTLIRLLPLPFQRIIGDLSQKERILMALNLSF